MSLIMGLLGKALYDVGFADFKSLDDGTERKELERCYR